MTQRGLAKGAPHPIVVVFIQCIYGNPYDFSPLALVDWDHMPECDSLEEMRIQHMIGMRRHDVDFSYQISGK